MAAAEMPDAAIIGPLLTEELAGVAMPLSREEVRELWNLHAIALRSFRGMFPGDVPTAARFVALRFRMHCHYETLNDVRWTNEAKGS